LPNFEAAFQNHEKIPDLRVQVDLGNYSSAYLSTERFIVPEIIFKPNLLGYDATGVQYLVSDVLSDCKVVCRPELLNNVCLLGGTTLFRGFEERLLFELSFLNEEIFSTVKIHKHEKCSNINAAWYGGSIVAGKESEQNWFTEETASEKSYMRPQLLKKQLFY